MPTFGDWSMEFMRKRREKRDELDQMAVDQNEGREGQNERDIRCVLNETITWRLGINGFSRRFCGKDEAAGDDISR